MTYENTDGPALTPEQRKYLESLMDNLKIAVDACHEPLDTKVLGLLEIAHDLIEQQISLDVYHEWGPSMELDQALAKKDEGQKFLFLDNDDDDSTDTPSAEDLERWFGD